MVGGLFVLLLSLPISDPEILFPITLFQNEVSQSKFALQVRSTISNRGKKEVPTSFPGVNVIHHLIGWRHRDVTILSTRVLIQFRPESPRFSSTVTEHS